MFNALLNAVGFAIGSNIIILEVGLSLFVLMVGTGTSSCSRGNGKGKGVKVTTGGSTTAKRVKGLVKRKKHRSPSSSKSDYEFDDQQSNNASSEDVPKSTTSANATNDNHAARVVYDKTKFVSSKAYRLFNKVLKNWRVLYEREVDFKSLKNEFVNRICELHNYRQLMSFSGDG